jgi:hypothetical protein
MRPGPRKPSCRFDHTSETLNGVFIRQSSPQIWMHSLPDRGMHSRHAFRSAFNTSRDNEPGKPRPRKGCLKMFPTPVCLEKHRLKKSISSGDGSALTFTKRPAPGIGTILGSETRPSDGSWVPDMMRMAKSPKSHRSLQRFNSVSSSGKTLRPNGAGNG